MLILSEIEITPRVITITVLSLVIFIAVNAGAAYTLQSSLYIVRKMGAYQHWALILMILPFISGCLMYIAHIPFRAYIIPLGSVISALILFPAYRDHFWAEPPHLIFGFVYAAIVGGIALIPNQRPIQQLRDLGMLIQERIEPLLKKGSKRKRKVKKPIKPKPVAAKSKKSVSEKNAILRFFESPQYTNLMETMKHIIALASILLSLYSIVSLGKP